MPRLAVAFAFLILLATALPQAPAAAGAPDTQPITRKYVFKQKSPYSPRYGFLPGYRPPEVIERDRRRAAWANGPRFYGPAWPGFYRNRWNGGGFGPCYTYTPIGYVWNCGK